MFPRRLRELRKEFKLTAKEFGEKFKLAESTISGYETGTRSPDLDLVDKFADFFGVTVDYLMGRSNKRTYSDKTAEAPVVQLLMRSKDEMSPESFERLSRVIEELTKSFVEEVDSKLDGDKK